METLIGLIPTEYWPYAAAVVTGASVVVRFLPKPSGANKVYLGVFNALRWLSLNKSFAIVRK